MKRIYDARNRVDLETATSGNAGLEIIRSQGPFAVVVSDMRMPEMDGARFLAKVNEIAPQTVRMVLSGQAAFGGVNQHLANHATQCPLRQQIVTDVVGHAGSSLWHIDVAAPCNAGVAIAT